VLVLFLILFCFIILISALLFFPVASDFVYGDNSYRLTVKWLGCSVYMKEHLWRIKIGKLFSKTKKQKSKSEKVDKIKKAKIKKAKDRADTKLKPKKKTSSKISVSTFWQNRKLLIKLLSKTLSAFNRIIKSGELKKLKAEIMYLSSDPALAGASYGFYYGVIHSLLPDKAEVRFNPLSGGTKSDNYFEIGLKVKPYRIMMAVSYLLFSIPKVKTIKFIRSIKKG